MFEFEAHPIREVFTNADGPSLTDLGVPERGATALTELLPALRAAQVADGVATIELAGAEVAVAGLADQGAVGVGAS